MHCNSCPEEAVGSGVTFWGVLGVLALGFQRASKRLGFGDSGAIKYRFRPVRV